MEHKIDEKKQGGYYLKQFVVVGGDLRCHGSLATSTQERAGNAPVK